ncbi:unnamed protein product [Chrysoparadoxa australica]
MLRLGPTAAWLCVLTRSFVPSASLLRPLTMSALNVDAPQPSTEKPRVIVIAGPTATGKSSVAMSLCKELGGEIVSADSVQVYRHLDIGSNKAGAADRAAVPHHLIDICDPTEEYTAGEFVRHAKAAIDDIHSRGLLPVVVGGTMMYVQWLVGGVPDAPKSDPEVVARVEEELRPYKEAGDWSGGLAKLAAVNETRAEGLFENDWYRLHRSLEITQQTPAPFTGERVRNDNYDFRCIFLMGDRKAAAERINDRCITMLAMGLLNEVADLLVSGRLIEGTGPAKAIGYRQAIEYLMREGHQDQDADAFLQFVDTFASKTRQYAQGQGKWFRSSKGDQFWWANVDQGSVLDGVKEVCQLPAAEYQGRLMDQQQIGLRDENRAQARGMRTHVPTFSRLEPKPKRRKGQQGGDGGELLVRLLVEADACTRRVQLCLDNTHCAVEAKHSAVEA